MAMTETINDAMLTPVIRGMWSEEDKIAAEAEGWAVREATSNETMTAYFYLAPTPNAKKIWSRTERLQLRKEVTFYVASNALNGSDMHRRALAMVGASMSRANNLAFEKDIM